MSDHVSADGSPLALYLAIPAGDGPTIVHDAVPAGASILELGSGPGRMTRVLIALGHRVTAVDDAEEMLAHVTGADTVCADVLELDLGRRFDVVLAASQLVNHPTPEDRRRVLDVCRRHVHDHGDVLVERYPPGWLAEVEHVTNRIGPVSVELQIVERRGDVVVGRTTYELAGRTWTQEYETADIDDERLAAEAPAAGLRLVEHLTDDGRWIRLRPVAAPS
ncbi:MAG TPA: class I SAM-dependent methyltransferase [Iamia sp.]